MLYRFPMKKYTRLSTYFYKEHFSRISPYAKLSQGISTDCRGLVGNDTLSVLVISNPLEYQTNRNLFKDQNTFTHLYSPSAVLLSRLNEHFLE